MEEQKDKIKDKIKEVMEKGLEETIIFKPQKPQREPKKFENTIIGIFVIFCLLFMLFLERIG